MGVAVTDNGSAFRRRQLGRRLRRLREDAGKTPTSVEVAGIVRRNHVWRIEEGHAAPRWTTVKELCLFYGADEETTAALIELAKAKGVGWFERYGDAVPKTLDIYLGAELSASEIDTYDPEVIHGILQTEQYARALFVGERPDLSPREIEELVGARLERQAMFWARRPEGAMLRTVLNEAALARRVGGHGTMSRQLEHLRELDGHEGVEIRVLPWSAGAHRAIYGGYAIFRFPDPFDPTVTYVESYSGGTYLTEEPDLERMFGVHAAVLEQSIPLKGTAMSEINDTTPWRKATASSGGNGGCLEFRRRNRKIEFRDSKQGDAGHILEFTRHEIECFLAGRSGNEFADLLDGVD